MGWVGKMERYFRLKGVLEDEKVEVAMVALQGKALAWFQWWESRNQNPSWMDFKGSLLRRFQPVVAQNPFEVLLGLKQEGSVAEYREKFETNSGPLKIGDANYLKGIFLNGLKEEVKAELRKGEGKLNWKNMTDAEYQERRRKGICFRCEEKYSPGHVCKNKQIRIMLLEEGVEEMEEEEEIQWSGKSSTTTLDFRSMVGMTSKHSFKFWGKIGDNSILILIDCGASHNFIAESVVKKLGLRVEKTEQYWVKVEKYFLGIEVAQSKNGIVISQRKYKKLVGKLNYLTITRPDISFAVSVVSQFLNSPCAPGKGLLYDYNNHTQVVEYSDADWAGSPYDKRSTSVVRLHGFPKSIVTNRDKLFLSQFWSELFKSAGTKLTYTSAYHPQSDGQTEVVNRCLEDYLRCFVGDKTKQWPRWLAWEEFCFNTHYNQSAGMTPFKAVYGRDPPAIFKAPTFPSKVESVNVMAEERDGVLEELKANIGKAQHRMKQQADRKRRDVNFEVGDWVYLKAQPYRLKSLAKRRNEKLGPRYYGPFRVLAKVGAVAYKLQLPESSRIHPVFHVSKLKKAVPLEKQVQSLPEEISVDWELQPQPAELLSYRYSRTGELEVLIQWHNLPDCENSWETATKMQTAFPQFFLEDKVIARGESIDRGPVVKQVYVRREKGGS
uniref:Retrotransposable element Tf2 n=1 Tax=Cajanus cajan TaxID=3821 RepID=A0A151SB88_CAJCA|nr:Retrotransposable element Tf2 [Cajanus cajan]